MLKYWKKLTASARGETFNPLIWPCLFTTLAYGLGFAIFLPLGVDVGSSTLYNSMNEVGNGLALFWGWVAIATIIGGLFFLLFNKPPVGKFTGLVGFMVWLFAAICYASTGDWLVFWAITFPNMWFWGWQYLSLSLFRNEQIADKKTMERYDAGGYDDVENPKDSKTAREDNRGQDKQ